MGVGQCAVIKCDSESDAKEEIKKSASARSTFFPNAEFVVDMENGPTSFLTFLIYSSRDELEAEAALHNEYVESV